MHALRFGALQIKENQETIDKMVCFQQFYRYLLYLSINWHIVIQIIFKSSNVSLGLKNTG